MFTHRIDEDLELRLPRESDAEEFFALIESNREYLREWMPWLDGSKTVEIQIERAKQARMRFAEGKSMQTYIWYEGKIAGSIGTKELDQTRKSTEIGYWLSSDLQKRGIVTRSCGALVEYLFNSLDMNRVEIQCDVKNIRSQKVPERLGFKKEGVLRQNHCRYGEYVDSVVYSILSREWAGSSEKRLS